MERALTPVQLRFVDHYLTCKSAAQAARLAGYSERSAKVRACKILKKPSIQAEIAKRTLSLKITKENVLKEVTDIAREETTKKSDRLNAYALIAKIKGWTKEGNTQQVSILTQIVGKLDKTGDNAPERPITREVREGNSL